MSDRIVKWRDRALAAGTAAAMAGIYPHAFPPTPRRSTGGDKKTFNSKMPPVGKKDSRGAKQPKRIPSQRYGPYKKEGKKFSMNRKLVLTRPYKPKLQHIFKKATVTRNNSAGYTGQFLPAYKHTGARYMYEKHGAVISRETRGTKDSPDCVYIGHGTPQVDSMNVAWQAVYKALLAKSGIHFTDWGGRADLPNIRIRVSWQRTAEVTYQDTDYSTLNADQTHLTHVDGLIGALRAIIGPTEVLGTVNYGLIQLIKRNTPALGTDDFCLARIDLNHCKIDFFHSSRLKMKNITLANDATDGDQIDNVEAQPLTGRKYSTKKWANGFDIVARYKATGAKSLVSSPTDGTISYAAAELSQVDGPDNPYRKPLPGFALGTKRTIGVKMQPGALKENKIVFSCKLNFNTFMKKMGQAQDTASISPQIANFGRADVIAVEREVEIGTPTTGIRIAWQNDNLIKAKITQYIPAALPIAYNE